MADLNYTIHEDLTGVRDLEFDQAVVNIGCHPENDVTITGTGILPFHATILAQSGQYHLIPMSPDAAIAVDGSPLQVDGTNLTESQTVQIGRYLLTVRRNGSPHGMHIAIQQKGGAQGAVGVSTPGVENAILVNLAAQVSEIAVQQTAVYQLEVINAGPIVASFQAAVRGVPAEWVNIKPAAVNLNEGQRATLQVSITPLRAPTSAAGKHPLVFAITSPNYPGQRCEAEAELTILPYVEFSLGGLSPRQVRVPWGRRVGRVRLPITNLGNSTADLNVSAVDDENGCSFDITVREGVELNRQATIAVPAGETAHLPIEITPLKQPIAALRSKRYHYTTSVAAPDPSVAAQTLSGSVVASPLFGWWVILLAVLGVLAGLFLLLQPRINYFQVAAGKDVIELGDSTTLEWSVSPFASRVTISGIDKPITRGQNSMTVTPTQSTTYEMVSGNWLSGMLSLDRKESLTVLTVPPAPVIRVFEVDRNEVNKGNSINLRWSVTTAEQAFLTIDEVVYELKGDKFSGEQAVVLENDAIVSLEARNASGSELRSFFINVVLPHIDVTKFTVWVRPQTAGLNSAQPVAVQLTASPRRALLRQQDTDFSQKLVELVPDESSDTGYRVEFYQPDRELAKGEQIMLEWEVDGVETVQIAPFTEVLPANGKQPFFPQESMNFVMTAKSGELQQLFMLPVKVFDGEQPKAPTIEFFTASPSKRIGPGDVQFAWSVTGEWTRVQLSSGEAVIADNLFAQGFKTTPVVETASFILTAWNGSLSSAKIIEVTIDPTLLTPTLTITDIYPHQGFFRVGESVNVFIKIEGKAGNPDPTGTVIVSDGFSICTVALPTVSCQPPLVFKTPGTKQIKASYSGDKIYAPVDSKVYTKEKIIVEANQVSLSPAYFYSEKGVKKSPIPSLSTASLKVGDGLYMDVSVIPESKIMADDGKGQVTVRYCPLNNKGAIIDSECVSAGPATVKLATSGPDASASIGHAELSINHLRKAGKFALLISYTHLDGAFEPVLIGNTVDTRIEFTVGQGVLLLIPQATPPCTYAYCLLHQSTDANVIFDAKLMLNEYDPAILTDDVMVDLFPTFPKPGNLEVTATKKSDNSPLPSWTNKCTWQISGSIHQLVCTNVDVSQDMDLRYLFPVPDANYTIYPKAMPIFVEVKEATEVVVNSTMFNNTFVGTIIELQKGKIYVREKTSGTALTNVNFTITIDGLNIADRIIKVDGSCTLDANNGLILTQGADYTVDTCRVAFKKAASSYKLFFDFAGNNDFDASTNQRDISAGKQNGIAINWQNNDISGNYQVFTYISTELDFTCPSATASCANFTTQVLTGQEIQFDLSAADSCKVYNDVTEVTSGRFTLPVPNGSGNVILPNVRFRCTTLSSKTLKVGFVSPATNDFGVSAGTQKNPTLVKYNAPMVPTIRQNDGTSLATYPLIGSPSDPITSSEWFVGVEYWVKVDLTSMPDDATPDATDKVKMVWPIALHNALDPDPAVSDCLPYYKTGTDPAEYYIPFEKSGTTWTAKCKFKFSSTRFLQPNDTIDFALQSTRFNNTNTNNSIDLPNAINKRTATIAPDIRINDGSALDTYPIKGSPTADIANLWVGEEYWAVVNIASLTENPDASDVARMVWPSNLTAAMDAAKSTCDSYATGDTYNIPFVKNGGGWRASCKFVLSSEKTLKTSDQITFNLVSNRFSDSTTYAVNLPDAGVLKMPVTMTISVINGAVKTADSEWYALSNPRIQVVLSEYETHFQGDLNTGLTCASGFLTVTSKIGNNAATTLGDCQKTATGNGTATFTYDLPDDSAYTATITASYANAANVFADSSATKTVKIVKIPVSISLSDLKWIDSGNVERPFPEQMKCLTCDNWPTKLFVASRSYTVTITVTATAPVGSEPIVTQGRVRLSLLSSVQGVTNTFEANVANGKATFTGVNPSNSAYWSFNLGHKVEFYNANAFEDASASSSTVIMRRLWQTFSLENWSGSNGFRVADTTNNECFDVYLEVDGNDADAAQCEGQSCWYRTGASEDEKVAIECGNTTGYAGAADDRTVSTNITFQPQNSAYKYQLYILNGIRIGYIKQGWPE